LQKELLPQDPLLLHKITQKAVILAREKIIHYLYDHKFFQLPWILDQYHNRIMHLVAREGFMSLVEWVMVTDRDLVNVKNKFAETPLHLACEGGHLEVVKYL
jgi:hypothetical protein